MKKKHIMIFAGEISGENHSYHLIKAIKKKQPHTIISGVGSGKMLETDFYSLGSITQLNAFQLHILKRFYLKRKLNTVISKVNDFIKINKPEIFIFVGIADDTQYFVIKLLDMARKYGIKTAYYFSPHVWMWSKRKSRKVANEVDVIFTFFERENQAYKRYGAKTVCVGHPIIDELPINKKEDFQKKYKIPDSTKIICLLPGSRKSEIKIHCPLLLKICKEISNSYNVFFISAVNPNELNKKKMKQYSKLSNHCFMKNNQDYYSIISNCDLCITCSGTASLETSVYKIPQVVFYKLPIHDYLIWRIIAFFARIKFIFIAMPNIIVNKEIVPEFVQNKAKVTEISKAVIKILSNDSNQKKELSDLLVHLGNHGAIERTALYTLEKMI